MNLELPHETEALLRSKASAAGMDIEHYVVHLVHLDDTPIDYDEERLEKLAREGMERGFIPRANKMVED